MWLKVKQWLWETKFQVFVFQIPLLFAIVGILLLIGYQIVQDRLNQGKWETLKSEELGYKIDYPAGWSAETFREGFENKHRGLLRGVRAFIYDEFFMAIDRKNCSLFWLPTADLEEAVEWGKTTIEHDKKSVILQEGRVGVGPYPAWTRSYQVDAGTRKVVYIPVNDGVFVLKFFARNHNEKIETIFNDMLASFEILS